MMAGWGGRDGTGWAGVEASSRTLVAESASRQRPTRTDDATERDGTKRDGCCNTVLVAEADVVVVVVATADPVFSIWLEAAVCNAHSQSHRYRALYLLLFGSVTFATLLPFRSPISLAYFFLLVPAAVATSLPNFSLSADRLAGWLARWTGVFVLSRLRPYLSHA